MYITSLKDVDFRLSYVHTVYRKIFALILSVAFNSLYLVKFLDPKISILWKTFAIYNDWQVLDSQYEVDLSSLYLLLIVHLFKKEYISLYWKLSEDHKEYKPIIIPKKKLLKRQFEDCHNIKLSLILIRWSLPLIQVLVNYTFQLKSFSRRFI